MATDSYGRNVGDMSPAELMSALQGQVRTTSSNSGKDYSRLVELMEQMAKRDPRSQSDSKTAKKWAETTIDFFKNFKHQKTTKGAAQSNPEIHYLKKIADSTSRIWDASQKQNTLWFGISKLSTRAQKQIASAIKMAGCCGSIAKNHNQAMATASAAAGRAADKAARMALKAAGGGGGRNKSGVMIPPADDSGGGAAGLSKKGVALGIGKMLVDAFQSAHSWMVKMMDVDLEEHVFGGLVKGSNVFRENMRQIVHQQIGFGIENREIEKQFLNIESAVRSTGVRADEFAKHYTANIQRGLELASEDDQRWGKRFSMEERAGKIRSRQMSRILSITTSALSTAQALGMSTDAVNDTFMDWHMSLSASAGELADMGRHMMNIARDTGVTGKQLESAMKSSDRIMKALKSAGSFSASAGKNVLSMTAAFEKYGIGEKGSEMLQALSSRHGFMNAQDNMKSMLSRIGFEGGSDLMNAIQGGSVLSNKTMSKKAGEAHESLIMKFTKQSAGNFERFGIEVPKTIEELEKAIQQLHGKGGQASIFAGAFDQNMRNSFGGMGVGDNAQMNKAFKENSMTSGERIAKMQQDMAEMIKNGRENTDAFRQLQRKSLEAVTNEQLTGFQTIQSKMQKTGVQSWNTASAEFQQQVEKQLTSEMGKDRAKAFLADFNKNAGVLVNNLSERAKAQGENLDKILKSKGTSVAEITKKLQSGDRYQMEDAQQSLDAATQELQKLERSKKDPITDIRKILTDWNTSLFGVFMNLGSKLDGVTAKILYVGGYIVTLLGEIVIALGALKLLKGIAGSVMEIPAVGKNISSMAGLARSAGVGFGGVSMRGALAMGGRIAGMLMPLVGAVKGFTEAEEAKRSKGEGMLFGALTGSAGTGSMFSSSLGLQKGGTGDKALGVAGAGMWGAAAGAAIGSIIPGVGTAIGAVVGGAIGIITELFKLLTEGSKSFHKFFIEPFEKLWDTFTSILGGIWDILSGLLTFDFKKMFGGFEKIGQAIWDQLKYSFKLAGDYIKEVILEIPNMLLDGFEFVVVKLPEMIIDGMIDGLKSLSENEYIGAIFKPFLELWKTIKGTFLEVKQVVQPIIDSLRESWNAIKETLWSVIGPLFDLNGGASIFGSILKGLAEGIGIVLRVALWPLKKMFETLGAYIKWWRDNVLESVKTAFQVLGEKIKWLLDTVWAPFQAAIDWLAEKLAWIGRQVGKVKDVKDTVVGTFDSVNQAINPFAEGNALDFLNPFAVGTREIQNDGVAMLHAGEMIVPKEVWESIKAAGNGPFGDGGGVGGILTDAFSSLRSLFGDVSGGIGMGLFDSGQIGDAADAGYNSKASGASGFAEMIGKLAGTDLNNVVSSAIDKKQSEKTNNSVAELSKALYYSTDASDSANNSMFRETSSNSSDSVSSNPLDYRDQMGGVNTLALSRAGMEMAVGKEKYGSESSSSGIVPNMDAIADYLISEQAARLEQMVNLLEDIKYNTAGGGGGFGSTVIGKISDGIGSIVRPGVKSIARDTTRGFWDLTFGDSAPGTVNNEGRGGSA